jgi:3-hydroxy acid dehydrogenase/malonic semialdehyde reductase
MNNLTKKSALITGASSGIGKAMALALDGKVSDLVLVARRREKLEEVAAEIKLSKVHIIPADINDPQLGNLISEVSHNKIDILINNAGLALGREKVEASRLEDWDQMISTNITANFKMVHLVLPWMLENGGGDIINLCSVAGHYTYSGGAVYCATKHAVKAFTRVLREETCGRNVRVMQISPGMVETDFSKVRFKGDESAASSVYANMTPLTGEDIARMMVFMLEQPRHVVIDEIITMPSDQGSPTTVTRRNS